MANTTDIKGIIFDYGGTIDCNGDHWAVVLRDAYDRIPALQLPLDVFIDAYIYAERELARTRHIMPEHNFLDMLRIKARIELGWLVEHGYVEACDVETFAESIAQYCYGVARASIEAARPTLEALAKRYPLVLVTNFYGNVQSVLDDFGLSHLFPTIIESAVVGVRKPDPAIFRLGVEAMKLSPEQVLVVGDSISKDILPAESLGCRTAWIKGKPWFKDADAPERPDTITRLSQLLDLY